MVQYLFMFMFFAMASFHPGPSPASQPSGKTLFARRFLENPSQVGSLLPSSQALTLEMTRYCLPQQEGRKRRILEIGAGTGAFTRKIIDNMGPEDTFDVVELDPQFAKALKEEFQHVSNVTVHEIDILDFFPVEPYDVIVSGLPLNAFGPGMVDHILRKYIELSKENGIFSYFDYPMVAKLKKSCLLGNRKRNFSRVLQLKQAFADAYQVESKVVPANVPPARVIHCQIKPLG